MSISGRRLQRGSQQATGSPSETVLSVTDISTTGATLQWTPVAGSTGYLVGRNGNDSHGGGPYQTTDPASATTRQFIWLQPGTSYTFFCEPQPGGVRKTISVTTPALPAGNGLYLGPASGSYRVGDTIALDIRENSRSNNVNAVQANLTYSASSLQFQSVSNASSLFTSMVENEGGSGSVKLGVGIMGDTVSGDQLVGRVTFTALASGTAAVSFASGSGIASADTNTDISQYQSGGSYSVS